MPGGLAPVLDVNVWVLSPELLKADYLIHAGHDNASLLPPATPCCRTLPRKTAGWYP